MANDVSTDVPGESIDYLAFLKRRWTPDDFAKLGVGVAICGTLFYFFGVVQLYQGMPISMWAWNRYAPEFNFEHGKLVLPIFAFLVWYHRDELAKAKKEGCNAGLIWVAAGCLLFAAGARTLQGRLGMAAGPVILYGVVLYVWGKAVAKIMLFPIAFLVFMIPVLAVEQATFKLQFLVTGTARVVCRLLGMNLYEDGTTLIPVDKSFAGFDVAEGCSGIRSLMAMVMVTAIYVHLTETKLWRKTTILLLSVGFAIIGNAGRITSIFLVAKYFGAPFAGGPYHEVSGFVSFPIALAAMLGVSRVLDMKIFQPRPRADGGSGPGNTPQADVKAKPTIEPGGAGQYDY
jgi:exosortase